MADSSHEEPSGRDRELGRRGFLSASSIAMTGGLVAGYGAFFGMAGRYLYPAADTPKASLFVTELAAMAPGDSLEYEAPTGVKVVIARRGDTGTGDDFVALSNTCPHLGCKVEWQPHNNRFFCPCHNGVFDPEGTAIEGPPAAAGQSLPRYELTVEGGLLFIKVPIETVVDPPRRGLDAPERRPALGARRVADRGSRSRLHSKEA
jgi:Rieske Fe-S protein